MTAPLDTNKGEPMKTLPEIRGLDDKLREIDLEFLHGVPVHLTDEMIAQIKQAIAKELMGCLPEKKTGTIELGDYPESEIDQIEEDAGVVITYRQGYNHAISEVRARLTAFIGRDSNENS